MPRYLAGVDVGTSGARCTIFDLEGTLVAAAAGEYGASYPKPGWVEQDGRLLLEQTLQACRTAVGRSGVAPDEIAAIGFSAQRSVTCPVDRDGQLLRPQLSWQDARTGAEVEDLRRLIDADEYYQLSGVPLGTTWLVTKLLWLRKHEPEVYQRTWKFVQNQDWVLKAFGADDFYTDVCCMAFYGLWDVRKLAWNDRLLRLLDLTADRFGKPTPAGTQVGTLSRTLAEQTGFAAGTPICVGAGDQNCSAVGMGAIRGGIGTVTLGTAGLAILCVDRPVAGFGGMMITNHAVPGKWEVEGLSNAAASSYRWFRDVIGTRELDLESSTGRTAYEYLNDLAAAAEPGSKGLLYLPYLATAATPRWNPDARSAFLGMSFAHGRAELTRSVMEGVVLEIRDIMQAWLQAGMQIDVLRIGGGATRSPLWNQIQADVYGRPVQLLKVNESTGLGSALLGGVGAGVFHSIDEGVATMVKLAGQIEPDPQRHAQYEELYQAYVKAYEGLTASGAFAALARIQAGDTARNRP